MAFTLLALGNSGARVAESYLYCAMAGVVPVAETHMVLMGASDEASARLMRLCDDYAAIQRRIDAQADTGFSAAIDCVCWPDGNAAAATLREQSATGDDALLCDALFTAEQASLAPSHALDASGAVSAMTWASLLLCAEDGPLQTAAGAMAGGGRCVITGSLCEPVCAGGAALLAEWLERRSGRKALASLLLPLWLGEKTELCKAALLSGSLERAFSSLCLTGLPEDCRLAGQGGAHLADWLAAVAAARMLGGLTGQYTWRIPAGAISWSLFGNEEETMCRRFDALMQTAILMHTQCGPRLLEVENNTGWLRDRMTPWYAAYFGDVRGMSQESRASLAQDVRALLRLLSGFGGWMHSMMLSLPAVCQWADALREGREAAEAHYAQVLEVAGHLAWMEYEAEKSGLKDERIVHRHDMSDNEGEAAMRQIGETRDELQSLLEDQHALNLRIGARLTRAMLSDARDTEKAQADELAAQAAEARRRINHALEIASPEEVSRVETARIRLGRMERHVALLNGRAERARCDLDIWNGDDRRTLPPTMEAEAHEVAGLYPVQLLTALSSLASADGRDQKKLLQQLSDAWLWTYAPKACIDALSRANGARHDRLGDLVVEMGRLPCNRKSADA